MYNWQHPSQYAWQHSMYQDYRVNEFLTLCNQCGLGKGHPQPFTGITGSGEHPKVFFIFSSPPDTPTLSIIQPWFDLLEEAGIDYAYTYAVKCQGKQANDQQKLLCRKYLMAEIDYLKPEIIVALGADSLKALEIPGIDTVTSGRKQIVHIGKMKVITTYAPGMQKIWQESGGQSGQDLGDEYQRVFVKISDIISGSGKEYKENIVVCRTTGDVEKAVAAVSQCSLIALDFENPSHEDSYDYCNIYKPLMKVLSFAFTGDGENAYVVPGHFACLNLIKRIVDGKEWTQANVKYDLQIANNVCMKTEDAQVEPKALCDPMLRNFSYDHSEINHGLKKQVEAKLGIPDWSKGIWDQVDAAKSKDNPLPTFADVNPEDLYIYNGKDALYSWRLEMWHRENHSEPPEAYQFMLDCIPTLAWVESTGLPIDERILATLKGEIQQNIQDNETLLQTDESVIQVKEWAATLKPKEVEKTRTVNKEKVKITVIEDRPQGTKGQIEGNYMSPDFLKALAEVTEMKVLGVTNKGAASIPTKAITAYAKISPVWAYIKALRDERNLMSKFIGKMERHCVNNRVHTVFHQTKHEKDNDTGTVGTATGRLSSEPNIQNLKNDPVFLSIFQTPPGYCFIKFDYPQIELRLIADAADVKVMKVAFKYGLDLHTKMACDAFPDVVPSARWIIEQFNKAIAGELDEAGIDKLKKVMKNTKKEVEGPMLESTGYDYRHMGKQGNFQLSYEGGPASFAEKNDIPLHLAKIIDKAYSKNYPEWIEFREMLHGKIRAGEPLITHYGRKRFFTLTGDEEKDASTLRQGPNYWIQPDASDTNTLKACEMHKEIVKRGLDGIEIVNLVHDSPWFIVRMDRIDDCMEMAYRVMSDVSTLPWDFSLDLPINECKIGFNLGYLKEVKTAEEAREYLKTAKRL